MLERQSDALLQYVESMLVHELIESIIVKHVGDEDVIGACFDKVYAIIEEAQRESALYRDDHAVDVLKKT